MKITALIVAAGRGTRAQGSAPKQWQDLAGISVLERTIAIFETHRRIDQIMLVLHPDDLRRSDPIIARPKVAHCIGGATRNASVRAGLAALAAEGTAPDLVLIHDVARPLLPHALIDRVLGALENHAGAAPGLPVTDALWHSTAGMVSGVQDRAGLMRAQTPQGFHFDAILAAHLADEARRATNPAPADDVEVARAAGIDVQIVPGSAENLKITLPEDFTRAANFLAHQSGENMDIRTGSGYDVHAFCPGDHVVLCGVKVAHDRALLGHSDADVGMHALTDALYGALAAGDIGQHFPPSDAKWKGAESHVFLQHAADLVRQRGYRISNVDVTLICEMPKIGPHAAAMRACLAGYLGVERARVSVKATTSEGLGFTGRKEGIAAQATATLLRP